MFTPRAPAGALPTMLLLGGLLLGPIAHAREPENQRPHWVIVATIIDRETGEQVEQDPLTGPELEFDGPAQCQAILNRLHPDPTDHFALALTCRKVGPRG